MMCRLVREETLAVRGNNSRQRLAKTTLEKQSVLAEEESGLAIGVKKQGRGEREPNPKWRTSVTQFEKLRVTDEEPLLFIWREMTLSLGLAAERIRGLCAFLVAPVLTVWKRRSARSQQCGHITNLTVYELTNNTI